MNRKCIICDKLLEQQSPSKNAAEFPMIWDGVVFRSSGQFGSRLNDCNHEIQVIICDQCLIERIKNIDTIQGEKSVTTARYEPYEKHVSNSEKTGIIEQLKKDGAYVSAGQGETGSKRADRKPRRK